MIEWLNDLFVTKFQCFTKVIFSQTFAYFSEKNYIKLLVAIKKIVFYYNEKNKMISLNKPLSNLQIELLQLYSQGISDTDLIAIKRLIANYFAEQASNEMDRLWEENNWSNDTMDKWLTKGFS